MLTSRAAWADLSGRAGEIEALTAVLERGAVHGSALALAGKTGIGKTALLSAALAAGRASGMTTLHAAGVEFESAIGYSALNQLLVPLHHRVAWPEPSELLSVALGLANGPVPDRSAVTDAVRAFLSELAAAAPVLIGVDDLRWVDRPTAEVMTAVARRPPARVAVVVAYRTDAIAPIDVTQIAHHTIAPLDADASEHLLAGVHPQLGPRARRRVLAQAEGIPLLLIELPNALDERQRQDLAPLPSVLPLGQGLHDVFAARVLAHPEPVRRVLLLAALDGHAELAILARAVGTDPAAFGADGDLLAAVRAGLIGLESGDDANQRVVFVHPLVRATVVQLASSAERRRAHEALSRAHAGAPERSAWHLGQAATAPDEHVAVALEHGANLALGRGDGLGALTALIRAGELSPSPQRRRRRLAQAAYLGADVTGDLHQVAALLAEIREADARQPLDVAAAAAHALLVGEGDIDTAHRLLVAGLHPEDGGQPSSADEPATRLSALYSLFEICVYAARPDLWPPLRDAVAQLGDAAPVHLRLMMSILADPARASDGALVELDRELSRVRAQHDPTAIERIATSALFVDRARSCHRALWQLVEDGRAGGAATSAVNAVMVLWADEFHSGHWDSSVALTREGQDLCQRNGLQLFAAPLRYGAGLVAAARGEHDRARQLAEAIDRFAAPRGMRSVQYFGWHVRALSACGQGDFAEAHQLFQRIAPGGAVPDNVPEALWMIFELVESAMRCRRDQYARAHVRSLDDLGVARISSRLALVCAGARAMASAPDEAAAHYDAALATPGASQWPFDLARVQLAYGEHLRRRRAPRQARQHLSSAADLFRSLAATPG